MDWFLGGGGSKINGFRVAGENVNISSVFIIGRADTSFEFSVKTEHSNLTIFFSNKNTRVNIKNADAYFRKSRKSETCNCISKIPLFFVEIMCLNKLYFSKDFTFG